MDGSHVLPIRPAVDLAHRLARDNAPETTPCTNVSPRPKWASRLVVMTALAGMPAIVGCGGSELAMAPSPASSAPQPAVSAALEQYTMKEVALRQLHLFHIGGRTDSFVKSTSEGERAGLHLLRKERHA